ncbi:MAG: tRNA (adenosine(37)-N6)-threonylcarbamoyltransferase complex dimerization subunit type 1 TsaB [Terriglobales bacterium]
MPQLLLALDTSGRNGSLALARVSEGKADAEVVEAVPLAGGTFSAQLVPQISALLARHRHTKSDLAAFAVVSGPGSFTGLRVGLAAIKALAEVLQKPIAAVSLLEVVACSSGSEGRVLATLDAGRSEVYVGDYELTRELPRMHSERLLTREELLTEAGRKGTRLLTPDAALAEIFRAGGLPCELIAYPSSQLIARLGWQHIQNGRSVRPEDLEANYIRRSDAEIFSQPRR